MRHTAGRFALPIFFALCLLMGGASNGGFLENFLLQIAGLIALLTVILLHSPSDSDRPKIDRYFVWVMLLWAIIVLVQFVPLPTSLWTSLPGREELAEQLAKLEVAPAPTFLTLSYHETISSLSWAIPATCLALILALKAQVGERLLAIVLVVCAFAAIILGLVQILGDHQSPAYLYSRTNRGAMVGFFANSNHMATFLLVALPFLSALVRTEITRRLDQHRELFLIWLLLTGFVVMGIGLVGSLTGYALAIPVLTLSALIMFPRAGKRLKLALIPAIALGVGTIAFTDEGGNMFAKDAPLSEQGRQQIFNNTYEAVIDFWPAGTGLGTFREVYRGYEDMDAVDNSTVNHAHNDYVEIALEFGLLGVIGIAAFVLWWLSRLRALWSAISRQPFVHAAAIGSGIILVHSAWDYPLRTAALSAVFAVCCTILARAGQLAPGMTEHSEKSRGTIG